MVNKKNKKETISLDRYSATPLFVQIAETLKRRILSGEYNQGKLSFTGEELEKEFNTSNITIRKALDLLRSEGIVERRRGIGTTFSEIAPEPFIFELSGSLQKMIKTLDKVKPHVRVIEVATIACPKRAQKILSVNPDQEVWRMKRIRKYKGKPVAFYTYYADPSLCEAISDNDVKDAPFSDGFQRVTGIKIDLIRQSVKSVVADLDILTVLKIPFGSPLLFRENIYYSPSGEVLFFSQSYYRGDMFAFKASVQL